MENSPPSGCSLLLLGGWEGRRLYIHKRASPPPKHMRKSTADETTVTAKPAGVEVKGLLGAKAEVVLRKPEGGGEGRGGGGEEEEEEEVEEEVEEVEEGEGVEDRLGTGDGEGVGGRDREALGREVTEVDLEREGEGPESLETEGEGVMERDE